MTDTTTKAVQQLADDIGKGRISRANTAAATLRALAQERDDAKADYLRRHQEAVANFHRAITAEAERDALAQERDAWKLRFDNMTFTAGQNLAERDDARLKLAETEHYADQIRAERDAARAEVERIQAAWLFVIQAENSCAASGAPCRGSGRCGCAAELEMLLREHDERAALAAKGEA